MFPARMFAPRMFPARYFAEAGAEAVAVAGIYFAPRMFAPRLFAPRMFPGVVDATEPTPAVRVPLEDALLLYLRADAAIVAKAGARVYKGIVPEKVKARPALVYRVISRVDIQQLDGPADVTRARIQLDAVGTPNTGPDVEALAYATRRAVAAIPADMYGVDVIARWVDNSGDEDEANLTGTDAGREHSRIDAMIHYRETTS